MHDEALILNLMGSDDEGEKKQRQLKALRRRNDEAAERARKRHAEASMMRTAGGEALDAKLVGQRDSACINAIVGAGRMRTVKLTAEEVRDEENLRRQVLAAGEAAQLAQEGEKSYKTPHFFVDGYRKDAGGIVAREKVRTAEIADLAPFYYRKARSRLHSSVGASWDHHEGRAKPATEGDKLQKRLDGTRRAITAQWGSGGRASLEPPGIRPRGMENTVDEHSNRGLYFPGVNSKANVAELGVGVMMAQADRGTLATPVTPFTPFSNEVKPLYRGLSTRECRPGVSAGGRRVRLVDDPNAESSSEEEDEAGPIPGTAGIAIGYGSPLYANDHLEASPMHENEAAPAANAGSSFKVFFKSALRPASKHDTGSKQGARVQILEGPPMISTAESPTPISATPRGTTQARLILDSAATGGSSTARGATALAGPRVATATASSANPSARGLYSGAGKRSAFTPRGTAEGKPGTAAGARGVRPFKKSELQRKPSFSQAGAAAGRQLAKRRD